MASHELKYTHVAAYKVGDLILTSVSKWNGLEELRDQQGRKLIVARDVNEGPFAHLFDGMFASLLPGREGTLVVLQGTPELLLELGFLKKETQ